MNSSLQFKVSSCRNVLVSLFLIGVAVFYFIFLAPYMTDNFVFSLDLRPGYAAFYTDQPVSAKPLSVASAFRQAKDMYFSWCGRYTGNLVVYLMFLLPHWLYSIVASLIFSFYILVLQMLVFGREWKANLKPAWLFAIAGMVWIAVPSFGEAFLWLSVGGQFALLGQALALLPCRFALDAPLRLNKGVTNILACIGLFLAGTIICSLDYPSSAALPVTCIACAAWVWFSPPKKNRRVPWLLLSESLGLATGAYLTLAAPGNACRMSLTTDTNIHEYILSSWGDRILSWLTHLPGSLAMMWVSWLFLAIAFWALWSKYGKASIKRLPVAAWLFLLPASLTYGAYLFTAWPPSRAFATVSMQLALAAFVIYQQSRANITARSRLLLTSAFAVFCCVQLVYQGQIFIRLHAEIQKREELLLAGKGESVRLPLLTVPANNYQVLGSNLNDIDTDPNFWVNRAMAMHYGVKEIKAIPPIQAQHATMVLNSPDPSLSKLRAEAGQTHISVSMPANIVAPEYLHYYYHGRPGILAMFPDFLADPVLDWLKNAEPGSWRMKLVPILLARTDIPIKRYNTEFSGISRKIRMDSRNSFWLVRPGDDKFSFNLYPLEAVPKEENK